MKIIITSVVFVASLLTNMASAQMRSNNSISNNITSQSAFIDASANGFTNTANNGKGIAFPRTNLTQFTFATQTSSNFNFPTAYDGLIVYNSASGVTPATGSGIGGQTVTPGFYYFSNPTGGSANSFASATGQWMPMVSSPRVNVGTSETVTNIAINNAQVYAIKGQFTANGVSTAVNIPSPTGMTGMYAVTIYKAGTNSVYAQNLYSYTLGTSAGNAVTGAPSMSVIYPAGTYDYVLEYLK